MMDNMHNAHHHNTNDVGACWRILDGKAVPHGKDGGAMDLGMKPSYAECCVAEYVWLDPTGKPRGKTKTLSKKPTSAEDLPVWNFDGSSTGQAPGHDSEIMLMPVAVFADPFRQGNSVLVMCECYTPDGKPAIGNNRAACKAAMDTYEDLKPLFGIEQEYTLMRPVKVGEASSIPDGFNADGSEPAAQGPYYCGVGAGCAIDREVAEDHYAKCMYAGVKIAGINAEVMPGQWEYQIGPCLGIEMGDHLMMSRYIMHRVGEIKGLEISFEPKPREGDWNGAGCHTNFSIEPFRKPGVGYDNIVKVCEAFGKKVPEHIAVYGSGNEKRLTGEHETCNIKEFKYGVADRGASIRIPRETFKNKHGYMEDRRPAANADPYQVTGRMVLTAGEAIQKAGLNRRNSWMAAA